ncbi:MAG TPA: NUDIX hydrolase N-terminal domain-containing protein [Candidatus Binataceae bacterium]|nr:NUDIX hydrolase N-terminal domain-containing protein [Candidatus Binataceae bacterium]
MPETDLLLELARFVERVSAIARTGLAFKPDGYDAERYHELLNAAATMHAAAATAGAAEAARIAGQWRDQVVNGYDGYVTPAVGCGAIAFNDRDEVLMLQRPSGRWWYPGGFCDVGLSPAENTAKEVREETGLIARPCRLMAVIDSRKYGAPARQIYAILFYCKVEGGELRPSPLEALDAGFFALERLPRPLHRDDLRWAELAREFHFEGRREPYFDL